MIRRITLLVAPFLLHALLTGCASDYAKPYPLLSQSELDRIQEADSIDDYQLLSKPVPLSEFQTPTVPLQSDFEIPPLLVRAQSVSEVPVGLSRVRDSVLQNNLGILVDRYQAGVEYEQIGEELGAFDATFSVDFYYGQSVEGATSLVDPTGSIRTDSFSASPGLQVPLATGGELEIEMNVYNYQQVAQDVSTIAPSSSQEVSGQQAEFSFSFTQPLLQGAGSTVALAPIVLADYSSRQAAAGVTLQIINTLAEAEQAYWTTWVAFEQFQSAFEVYEDAKYQFETTKELYAAQQATIVDVRQAQASVLTQASWVIHHEELYVTASLGLQVLMNDPELALNGASLILPSEQPSFKPFVADSSRAIKYAMAHRMDLLQLELQVAADTLEIQVAKNTLLPDVAFGAELGAIGITDFGVGRAVEDMFNGQQAIPWSLRLSASMPIGNNTAISAYRAALLQRLGDIADTSQQRLTIRQDVLSALTSLESSARQLRVSHQAEIAYRNAWKGTQDLFLLGQQTAGDVADALEQYGESRLGTIAAAGDYQQAMVSLAMSTGTTLGMNNIEWSRPAVPDDSN
ncbi:MAG: hypothetical protein CBC35_01920 [Planctomycetes bacterium TMED75]|nr:hypothetical protein [Planctomycetaceae bacterium]OUU96074.1 MAG: hypothetical protein CBC35_01920 [Planctomycetes bacterium TMED75]